jgi:valyl-tRNA synthetase
VALLKTADLQRFYPTDVMETGYDILFFWVARMAMAGALFTNDVPFHTVYLHGLVRDELGRKMSKTLNNVTDPLDVIAEYGTDALRFTLLTGGTPGNDLNLSLDRVASNRNFANKIWNATRFVTRSLERVAAEDVPDEAALEASYSAADRWVLTRLSETVATVDRLMDSYQFGEAGRQVYEFLWNDFADWYLEAAKVQLKEGGAAAWRTLSVLRRALDEALRLLHPYIPYVTEETWQQLRRAFVDAEVGIAPQGGWGEALIVASWPEAGKRYMEATAGFEQLRELVRRIRAVRAERGVEPARAIVAHLSAGEKTAFYEEHRAILAFLARLDEGQLRIARRLEPPADAVTIALGPVACYLPLAEMVDIAAERGRLQKELSDVEAQIARVSGLLGGPFAEKAPAAVVQKEREKLAGLEATRGEVIERLEALERNR